VRYNGTDAEVLQITEDTLISSITDYDSSMYGQKSFGFIGEEYIAHSREESWYDGTQQPSSLTIYSPAGEILGSFELDLEWGRSLTYFGYLPDPADGTVDLLFMLGKQQEEESVLYTLPIEEVLE
jgi:hypothetical protein